MSLRDKHEVPPFLLPLTDLKLYAKTFRADQSFFFSFNVPWDLSHLSYTKSEGKRCSGISLTM